MPTTKMGSSAKNMGTSRQGFSLVELAIVLVIIGIVVSIALGVGVAQGDVAKRQATQAQMDKINDAITVFFKTNGYLPCPGPPAGTPSESRLGTAINTASANGTSCNASGIVSSSGARPTIYMGIVPTRTLNLSDTYLYDGWGNRITYIVARNCVSGLNWGTTSTIATTYPPAVNTYACYDGTTTTNDGGGITMLDASVATISAHAAYVLISHGKDGVGAFNKAGTKAAGSSANSTSELTNGNLSTSIGTVGAVLTTGNAYTSYYDAKFNDGGTPTTNSNYFDDIVRWRSAIQILYDANN